MLRNLYLGLGLGLVLDMLVEGLVLDMLVELLKSCRSEGEVVPPLPLPPPPPPPHHHHHRLLHHHLHLHRHHLQNPDINSELCWGGLWVCCVMCRIRLLRV